MYEPKGYYKYKNYESIKNENKYNLDFSSLPENQFYYYGVDYIDYIYDYDYYISEKGSGILLCYYTENDDYRLVSNIYPNENIETALSNCTIISEKIEENYTYIYCRIKQEEIKYFADNPDLPLTYDLLCGAKEPTFAFVNKLDKSKYPVFKVKYFILPEEDCIRDECKFIIVANIEGSISEFTEGNEFLSIININSNGNTTSEYIKCEIPLPSKIQDNYELSCEILFEMGNNTESDSFYLTPYYMIYNLTSPFEIFIENNIKAIKYYDYKKMEEKTIGKFLLSLISNPAIILQLFLLLLLLIYLKLT